MQTLGDVVTAGLILAALIVVPYKIAKAWLWPYLKPMIMSRLPGNDHDAYYGQYSAVSPAETNSEIAETPQPVGETHAETFTLGETEALARLVASGKLGLTDAVKIGANAKSGEKYQRRSRDIKAAVARMQDPYPRRTPEMENAREALGLNKAR